MRYAPEHNEETRERILEVASRLFREQGIAAVGLAKIMAEAGLTVGTFYTHFKSKEALVRESLLRSLDARHEELEQLLHANDAEVLIRAYLCPEHRDEPGTGCLIATLAPEVARRTRNRFCTPRERTAQRPRCRPAPPTATCTSSTSASPLCPEHRFFTRMPWRQTTAPINGGSAHNAASW